MRGRRNRLGLLLTVLAGGLFLTPGCADQPAPVTPRDTVQGAIKKVEVGSNVVLEVRGTSRRVLVKSVVCLRQGPLEMLLTLRDKKTHESILAAAVDARNIHEALLLAGAKPGRPVQWIPAYIPPSGTAIRVTLEFEEQGKKRTVPGGSWIRNEQTGAELNSDWVFAGSQLAENQQDRTRPGFYLANEGDVICVSNFETALLDLPFKSSKDDRDRSFVAWTERIPPEDTPVTVILEPILRQR
jgi:hypothetical protein